jgi:hypothetical protein
MKGNAVEDNADEYITSTPATQNDLEAPPSEPKPKEEPSPYSKPCDLCQRRRDVLSRCQTDETGKCWTQVSGGRVSGDSAHPCYRYGGMWKNKHEAVSAKIKGKAKARGQELANGYKGPHRRHGHWRPKTKKTIGEVEIGDDDGGSDIEVSDVSDGVEDLGEVDGTHIGESHISVRKAGD